MKSSRRLININGVVVPGIARDDSFLSEAPIETFILFRSGAFSAGQSKSFLVEFPCKPRSVIIADANSDTVYTFTILTSEGVTWTMTFSPSNALQVTSYGAIKLINFPAMVLDEGCKVTVTASKAIQSIAVFTNLSYNVDIIDF